MKLDKSAFDMDYYNNTRCRARLADVSTRYNAVGEYSAPYLAHVRYTSHVGLSETIVDLVILYALLLHLRGIFSREKKPAPNKSSFTDLITSMEGSPYRHTQRRLLLASDE